MAFLAPSVELVVDFCTYVSCIYFQLLFYIFFHLLPPFLEAFSRTRIVKETIIFCKAQYSTGHGHEAVRLCGRGPTFNLVQSPRDEWEDVMNCALLHCCTAHWVLWRFVKCIVATVQGKWCLVGGMQSCSRELS